MVGLYLIASRQGQALTKRVRSRQLAQAAHSYLSTDLLARRLEQENAFLPEYQSKHGFALEIVISAFKIGLVPQSLTSGTFLVSFEFKWDL